MNATIKHGLCHHYLEKTDTMTLTEAQAFLLVFPLEKTNKGQVVSISPRKGISERPLQKKTFVYGTEVSSPLGGGQNLRSKNRPKKKSLNPEIRIALFL